MILTSTCGVGSKPLKVAFLELFSVAHFKDDYVARGKTMILDVRG